MSARFVIESVEVGTISLDMTNVSGQFGPEYPTLRLMLAIKLLPWRRHNGQTTPVRLLQLHGTLMLGNKPFGEQLVTPNIYSDRLEHPPEDTLEFPIRLDSFRVRAIEENRKGDFVGTLRVTPLFLAYGDVEPTSTYHNRRSEDLRIEIPQSHWIKNVLPGLGYRVISLLELPFPPHSTESFNVGAKELERAVTHLIGGNPAEAVASCRSAIQAVVDSAPTEKGPDEKNSFPPRVDRFVSQHLAGISKSKRDHIRASLTSLWHLASIPHHPGTEDYFERSDAEFIIRQTAALLSHLGHVLQDTKR